MSLDENFHMPELKTKYYPPLPVGVYQCELIDISNKEVNNLKTGEPEQQVVFKFAVIEEGENYGKLLWSNCTLKMVGGTKPSNLYKTVSGITGEVYTKEQCKNQHEWMTFLFYMGLVGKQNLLAVGQKPKLDGKMKNVIDSILPVKSQLPAYNSEKVNRDKEPF